MIDSDTHLTPMVFNSRTKKGLLHSLLYLSYESYIIVSIVTVP